MEDNFYNDDGFEEFLREQVKDHRLYPSDSIWRNINKELHGDINWPALTIAAFTLLGIIVAFSIYFSPSPDIFTNFPGNKSIVPNGEAKDNGSKNEKGPVSLATQERFGKEPIPYVHNNKEYTQGPEARLATAIIQTPHEPITQVNKQAVLSGDKDVLNNGYISQSTVKTGIVTVQRKENNKTGLTSPEQLVSEFPGVDIRNNPATVNVDDIEDKAGRKAFEQAEIPKKFSNNLPNSNGFNNQTAFEKIKKARVNKLSYLVYITPSKSYRKLQQNPIINKGGGPMALNYFVDVNKIARYTPGMGVEAGVNFMYKITDKLKVSSGLQFNVRQYSLEAYVAPGDISTIALINRSGNPTDTINSYAVYRTNNGYLSTELVNRYYEISLPIGLQWEVIGNRAIQLNVAASVQPTYMLNRNAYLISTDYKNYTVNPGLMHSWNINTSLEAYVTIKNGDFKWQFGPQFRYQNLPTFISTYPIHENLIDYGFKIGVSKNLK